MRWNRRSRRSLPGTPGFATCRDLPWRISFHTTCFWPKQTPYTKCSNWNCGGWGDQRSAGVFFQLCKWLGSTIWLLVAICIPSRSQTLYGISFFTYIGVVEKWIALPNNHVRSMIFGIDPFIISKSSTSQTGPATTPSSSCQTGRQPIQFSCKTGQLKLRRAANQMLKRQLHSLAAWQRAAKPVVRTTRWTPWYSIHVVG